MARKPKSDTLSKETPLTPKQESFARFFVETANASEAYRRAYDASKMKDTSVHVNACKLLAETKVAQRVASLQQEVAKRHDITVDKIIRELALIGFSNMLDYMTVNDSGSAFVDLSRLTRDQAAAIGELTSETYFEGSGEEAVSVKRTKFKLSDKRAALVDLGKHLGMFVERKEVTGSITHIQAPQATGEDHLEELTKRYATKAIAHLKPSTAGAGTKH